MYSLESQRQGDSIEYPQQSYFFKKEEMSNYHFWGYIIQSLDHWNFTFQMIFYQYLDML